MHNKHCDRSGQGQMWGIVARQDEVSFGSLQKWCFFCLSTLHFPPSAYFILEVSSECQMVSGDYVTA